MPSVIASESFYQPITDRSEETRRPHLSRPETNGRSPLKADGGDTSSLCHQASLVVRPTVTNTIECDACFGCIDCDLDFLPRENLMISSNCYVLPKCFLTVCLPCLEKCAFSVEARPVNLFCMWKNFMTTPPHQLTASQVAWLHSITLLMLGYRI